MSETSIYPIGGFFHKEVSGRARLAHSVGRLTLKPLLQYAPMNNSTLLLLRSLDTIVSFTPDNKNVAHERIIGDNWLGDLITPRNLSNDNIILYFHGGAFICCGLGTHKNFVERLSVKTGSRVLSIAYRQYPQVYYNDTVKDCVSSFRWLINNGFEAKDIILAGDSAGGGLAVKVAGIMLNEGSRAKGVISLSGWLDFTITEEEYKHWEKRDAYLPAKRVRNVATKIFGRLPTINDSPISQITNDFPSILMICGGNEILRVDSEKAFVKSQELGNQVELHYFSGGVHAFPVVGSLFPEGTKALNVISDYIDKLC